MKKRPKISKGDRDEIIIVHPQKIGEPRKIDIYFTTRAGISWATPKSPFYYCILGLKDEPTLTEKKPVVLLAEGEDPLMERFFERMTLTAKRLLCEPLIADFTSKGFQDSLLKYVREKKMDEFRRWNSAEFENLEHDIAVVKQWQRDSALKIPKGTILRKQIGSMTPDDVNESFKGRFYAVAALCRVLGSFEAYPWRKPTSGTVGFSNYDDRTRAGNQWNGTYQEFFFHD